MSLSYLAHHPWTALSHAGPGPYGPTGEAESMWMGWAIDRPRRVIFVGLHAGVRYFDGGLVGLVHGPLWVY